MNNNRWTWGYTAALIAIVLAFVAYAVFRIIQKSTDPSNNITNWIIMTALLTLFMAVVGYGITGRVSGILIDEANTMSLSRLQMVLWTLVILPAWLAAAVWNLGVDTQPGQAVNALDIAMPAEVWALLGISTASLVGTPLILNEKAKRATTQAQKNRSLSRIAQREGKSVQLNSALAAMAPVAAAPNPAGQPQQAAQAPAAGFLDEAAEVVGYDTTRGQLFARTSPQFAKASDMFHGDEFGNAPQVDLSKIQMFFFTLILVLAYTLEIGRILSIAPNPTAEELAAGIHQFPPIDAGMAALLAISHAGYLGYKATSHTESPDNQ
jgi:hypothetical protein